MVGNIAFLMIFAVFDPSPLTLWINCSFLEFIYIYIYIAPRAILPLTTLDAAADLQCRHWAYSSTQP